MYFSEPHGAEQQLKQGGQTQILGCLLLFLELKAKGNKVNYNQMEYSEEGKKYENNPAECKHLYISTPCTVNHPTVNKPLKSCTYGKQKMEVWGGKVFIEASPTYLSHREFVTQSRTPAKTSDWKRRAESNLESDGEHQHSENDGPEGPVSKNLEDTVRCHMCFYPPCLRRTERNDDTVQAGSRGDRGMARSLLRTWLC